MLKDKTTILKYLSGTATESEVEEILGWVKESEENKRHFAQLKKSWALNSTPEDFYPMQPGAEYLKLKEKINKPQSNTPPKNTPLRKLYSYWQKTAAILFLPLCLGFIWLYTSQTFNLLADKNQHSVDTLLQKEFFTPKGVRGKIKLADGTTVWLNSDSKLSYPTEFSANKREIELQGEAYLEVHHDENRPFIVKANNVRVKVLGTSFNVNASEKGIIETTLVSGAVEISEAANNITPMLLKPGYRATYHQKEQNITTKKVNPRYDIAWRNGTIILRDTPMPEVIKSLQKWYNVKIEVRNKEILKYSFTATLQNKTLENVLDLFRISSPLGYKIENNKVILYKTNN
ncbi:MAG: FecR family protein [Marinifilaceae bacterium]